MSAIFRAGAGNRGSTSVTLTIPVGVQDGDWGLLLVGGSNSSSSFVYTLPSGWTSVIGVTAMGTGWYAVVKKQFSTGDSNPTLSADGAALMTMTGVWWGGCDGFGTPGTVTTRSSSSTDTTALSVSGETYRLVLSAEKSNTSTAAPSVSPTTSQGAHQSSPSGARESMWIGYYSDTAATRTMTYATASSNGAALQMTVIDGAPADPATHDIFLYNGTTEVEHDLFLYDGVDEIPYGIHLSS